MGHSGMFSPASAEWCFSCPSAVRVTEDFIGLGWCRQGGGHSGFRSGICVTLLDTERRQHLCTLGPGMGLTVPVRPIGQFVCLSVSGQRENIGRQNSCFLPKIEEILGGQGRRG